MDLSRDELALMEDLILERWDDEHHYPNDYSEESKLASSSLYEKVKDAQHQRRRVPRV